MPGQVHWWLTLDTDQASQVKRNAHWYILNKQMNPGFVVRDYLWEMAYFRLLKMEEFSIRAPSSVRSSSQLNLIVASLVLYENWVSLASFSLEGARDYYRELLKP